MGWRSTNHLLSLVTDGQDLVGLFIDGNDGRFVDDDSPPPDVDQRVGGTEIDTDVAGEVAEEFVENHSGTKRPGDCFAG